LTLFFNAPGEIAANLFGAFDSVGIIDNILFAGGDTASALLEKGGVFQGFFYYIAGFAVYVIVGLTAIRAMFLLSLSKIALSVLLAMGPLFLSLLLFDTTRRYYCSKGLADRVITHSQSLLCRRSIN
jgi:type IV secretion system protein VirB6